MVNNMHRKRSCLKTTGQHTMNKTTEEANPSPTNRIAPDIQVIRIFHARHTYSLRQRINRLVPKNVFSFKSVRPRRNSLKNERIDIRENV